MSYIEKEKLIKADIDSIENRVRHAFNQGYDLGFKDGKKRTKSQKQKSILNKISTEIEEIETYDGLYIDRAYVLQIIDKYKAESEE